MLDQIVMSCAMFPDMGDHLTHHIQLMVTREDQDLFCDRLLRPFLHPFLLFGNLKVDELLEDVHHAVLPEHVLPEIGRGVAVGIGRIPCAAVFAGAAAALVEGEEVGILTSQLCGHPDLGVVHGEIAQDSLVELEADLPGVTVVHPLTFGIVHGLPRVLILQLKGKNRNAVDGQHHIHAVVIGWRIEPLPVAGDLVGGILLGSRLVQGGFRLEITDAESDPPMLEAVAENVQQTPHITGVVEGNAELLYRVDLIGVLEPGPLLGLGLLDKADQGVGEDPQGGVVDVAVPGVAAGGGQEEVRDVGLEAFFGSNHALNNSFAKSWTSSSNLTPRDNKKSSLRRLISTSFSSKLPISSNKIGLQSKTSLSMVLIVC